MRITAARVIPYRTVLRAGLADARHRHRSREGLLLRLEDERGNSGIGEAAPLPCYSPDTLSECLGELRRFGEHVRGRDVGGPASTTLQSLGELVGEAAPSARFAIESAYLDLRGKRDGSPACDVLHDLAGDATRPEAIPLCALVDGDSPTERLRRARQRVAEGYGALKVKVGVWPSFERELSSLVEIREALARTVTLRLDANRSFPAAELEDRLTALARIRPELLEEPCNPATLLRCCPDGPRAPYPFALDESLQGADAWKGLEPLLAERTYRVVVLKPTALGGLVRCIALAARARELGAEVIVSHCHEGPVAHAACGALALALGGSLATGLGAHVALEAWPGTAFGLVRGGTLIASHLPGLGVQLGEVPA